MVLNRNDILECLEQKRIFCSPAPRLEHIGTTSIDVHLGDHGYRMLDLGVPLDVTWPHAVKSAFKKVSFVDGFVIKPGECILAHTHEFIGGCDDRIVTMIKDRSTLGRLFLTTHTGAGWGDVGYHNRWTLEIKNSSPREIRLPRHARVAQVVFFEGRPAGISYHGAHDGSYQKQSLVGKTFEELDAAWNPESMLPVVRW